MWFCTVRTSKKQIPRSRKSDKACPREKQSFPKLKARPGVHNRAELVSVSLGPKTKLRDELEVTSFSTQSEELRH